MKSLKEKHIMTIFGVVITLTLLVNVLNLWPGYSTSTFISGFIDYTLNVDLAFLELLDLFIIAGCMISAFACWKVGKEKFFIALVLMLMIFFFAEEISYGRLFNFDIFSFFYSLDGADEGNFHNANFAKVDGLGLELTNIFYILGAPFFLFIFDQRFGLRHLREFLRLPAAELTDLQTLLYGVGCLVLPLDGLPDDIEMDQIFVNSVYFYFWIMCVRILSKGHALPAERPVKQNILNYARITSFLTGLRLIVYYVYQR